MKILAALVALFATACAGEALELDARPVDLALVAEVVEHWESLGFPDVGDVTPREVFLAGAAFEDVCGYGAFTPNATDCTGCALACHAGDGLIVIADGWQDTPPENLRTLRAHEILHYLVALSGVGTDQMNLEHDVADVWTPSKPGADYVMHAFEITSPR